LPVTAAQAASETAPVAQPAAQAGADIEVESALRAQLTADETTGYLIYFKEKPDLSPAYKMDWIERGRFVANALQRAAERSQANVRAYLDARGIEYKAFWIDNVISVESSNRATFDGLMKYAEIQAIRQHRQLHLIEPQQMTMAPSAPQAIEPNITHVLADQVWAMGYRGEGLVVASVDTGVRYTHQALVGHYRGNQGGGTFDHNYNWWDPYGDHPTEPGDDNGHGSHTMGTMVGDDGGANQIGMAPGAQWMACRGCNTSDCGGDELLECAQFFAAPWDLNQANANPDMRPNAVNNSWGDCEQSYDPWYQDVVDAWHAAGIYPIFSNGNAGNCGYSYPPGLNTVGNPGRYGNVTGVGSTGRDNGQYATHSNWGPTDNPDTVNPKPGWENLKPQVLAPGVNIRSSTPGSDSEYQGGWNGTSMSAPHVTGLIALMWSAAPCLIGDYATTETIIEDTATPIPYDDGTGGGAHVPNQATGWGEINALAAVQAAVASCGDSTITGEVLDAATNATIEGASIVATNAAGTIQHKAASNAAGVYVLNVFSDTYTLAASNYGYQTTVIPGVVATTGATTTQHIAMTPAQFYEVSGQVTDATTGWPLYAHISISGDPVSPAAPDNSVWTDPATGAYSVMLSEGVTYTFEVEAWVAGYTPTTGEVGPLTADAPGTDFALQADMGSCAAPGYSFTGGLMANFEDDAFPPAGWTVVNNGGTCTWVGNDPGGRGNLTGGTGKFAIADSDDCGSGTTMNTDLVSPLSDVSGLTQVYLSFAYDYNFFSSGEQAAVDVSADGGATWVNVVTWSTADLRGLFSQDVTAILGGSTQARVRFHYYAPGWDYWWEVDDVVLGNPVCNAPADGGLVVGNVYDENYPTVALNGATVANAAGGETTAVPTPLDAAVDDAFYTLFAPSGAQVFTATMKGYGPDVATVTVVDGDTVEQDFQLPAGMLDATPDGIDVTVELGYTESATLNLDNTGSVDASFELLEKDGGFMPLGAMTLQQAVKASTLTWDPEKLAGECAQYYDSPFAEPAEALKCYNFVPKPGVFNVIPMGETDPGYAQDIGYISDNFVTFPLNDFPGQTVVGTNTDAYYGMDFTPDGETLYALNDTTGELGTIDLTDGSFTGLVPCVSPSGNWTGLTIDPVTGDFYASDTTNLYMINPDTGDNTLIGAFGGGVSLMIDIAMNADGAMYGHDIGTDSIYQIDPATGAATLVGATGYNASYAQGMDFDNDDGTLYIFLYQGSGANVYGVVDLATGTVTPLAVSNPQGEFEGAAKIAGGADVLWLAEDPVMGTVAATGNTAITVDFDAAYVDQPGEYHAELIVNNDTPYGKFNVPVTMTVVAPQSWGKLTGTVTGLGVCDGDPAPLEEAEVRVESATTGQTWTVATDVNGVYTLWIDRAHSPLTVTVTAPDYFGETGGVVVQQGQTTVVDFDLRILLPCLSYDPADFDVTLAMGDNTVEPLTLSNTGAAMAEYELFEIAGGLIPLQAMARSTQSRAVELSLAKTPATNNTPATWMPMGDLEFAVDDGTAEDSIGLTSGGQFLWLNRFTPNAGDFPFHLDQISIIFNDTVNVGDDIQLVIWQDADSDPSNGAVLVYAENATVLNNDFATWNNYQLANSPVFFGPGDVLVGVVNRSGTSGLSDYPAAIDQSSTSQRRSWIGIYSGDPPDPPTLPPDSDFGIIDDISASLAGNWTLRASGATGTGGGAGGGIPWLTETLVSGTIAADTDSVVDLTFDAGVPETMQPGTYYGALKVDSNAANDVPNIPVTLTVTAPGSWGKIEGVVTGLGYCDVATPILLEEAEVTVESGTGFVEWTLLTDENGAYQLWLDAAHSPVTITVEYVDHLTQVFPNVVVTAGGTTVRDAALRWAMPCLTTDPDLFDVTVTLGTSTTVPFTLTNAGAGDAAFDLAEANGGMVVLHTMFSGANASLMPVGSRRIELSMSNAAPSAPSVQAVPWAPSGPVELVLDDGSAEDALGLTAGGQFLWLNRFTPDPDVFPFTLDQISILFRDSATVGEAIEIIVWEDTDGDGDPATGANLLYTADEAVIYNNGTTWNDYALSAPIMLDGPGDVLIGVVNRDAVGTHPAALDEGASQGRSWVGLYSGDPPEPPTLPPDSDFVVIDDIGFPGNWVVRGSGMEYVSAPIPWLSEDPESGAVDADDTFVVDLTFDASDVVTQVTGPGEYFGTLFVNSDDPVNDEIAVPVTMTVLPPDTWGKLMGTVTGQGYCDADPAPLVGADVLIESWMTETVMVPAVTTLLSEGFEGAFPPAGWTLTQTGTVIDDPGWGRTTSPVHSGSYAAYHDDNNSDAGTVSWMIMPQVAIPAGGAELTFWQYENWGSYAIYHGIWVSTASDDPADFVEVSELGAGTEDTWEEQTLDLSAYAGQSIYIAFRYSGEYADEWYVDDVSVTAETLVPADVPISWSLTTDVSGTYQIWLDEMYSPVTITVSYPDHEKGEAIEPVTGQETTTHDFDLRWLVPCVAADPLALHTTLELGATVTEALTLTNTGAVDTDWEIAEAGSDVVWLAEAPITGTMVADTGEQLVDVGFDASQVDQPGEYYADLWVASDDPDSPIILPVTMTVTPPASWGQVAGVVSSLGHCDVTTAALEGAEVVIWEAGGTAVVTLTTDAAGAYSYWLLNGTYTVTVAAADHVGASAVVAVPASGAVAQDFSLTWLGPCVTSIEPSAMEVTVAMGMSTTLPLTMTNDGAGALDFAFSEVTAGFVPTLRTLTPYQPPAASDGQAHSLLQYSEAEVVGHASAPLATSASTLLDQIPNQDNGLFSDAGCDNCSTGAQAIAENFTLSEGKAIGQIVFWTGYYSTDTPIDPDNLTVIFHSDDAGLPGANIYVETNVDYERVQTGVVLFGVHEWMHTLTLASPVILAPGNYWIEIYNNTGTGTDDFFWETGDLDPVNGLTGSVWAATVPGSGWNYDGATELSIQLLEAADIPWLFEDPESGAVPSATSGVADITFDAGVPEVTQPGTYAGVLTVNNSDPVWDGFSIPVTMHVTLPETYGQITGTVMGLGPCDDPATAEALEGAEVTIQSATQTWTLLTDADGAYALWLDEAHSPVTITVDADGYVTEFVADVEVISGMTTIQDFDLSSEAPCMSVTPADAHVTVAMGVSTTLPITVSNTGAADLDWEVREKSGGFQVMAPTAGEDVLVVAYDTTPATAMETALTNLGYSYLRVTRDAFQAMALADLLEYQAVFYAGGYSGDSWAKALAYLDAGGSFLIADNDLGYSNRTAPTTFYQTYLQSTYVSDSGSDGQLTGLDIMAGIDPDISADPYPDDFTVGAEGTCIFDAPSLNCAGIKVERLGYKAIYLAWDFYYAGGSAVGDPVETAIVERAMDFLAAGGVPWLDEDPTSGTVAPDATAPVTLTFDASVPEVTQPGDYYATLTFKGSNEIVMPVTMTVEPPATWGKIGGLVQGLGYCNAMTMPLEGAVIFVESTVTTDTWAVETDAAGIYGIWIDGMYSPFTVTISYEAGYDAQVFTGVEIAGGEVTTQNADLLFMQPCITVAPDALAVSVEMGAVTTVDLNLANLGAFTGTFEIDERSLGFDILGPLAAGGPDGFGYEFADSNSAGVGPAYGFVDISGIGTPVTLGDNDSVEVDIGFDFKFYGDSDVDPNLYDSVFVNSNGFLSFGAGSTDLSPDALPSPTLPNNLIAVAWDDLLPGTVYVQNFPQCPYNPAGTAVDACFIVQYDDFTHAGGAPAGTFQAILFRSGSILMQYETVDAPDASTGIEDALGIVGLNYGPALADELAICFAYPGEETNCRSDQVTWLSVDVDEGDIAAHDDATVVVTLDASVPEVTLPGDYLAELWVETNDPQQALFVIPVTMTVLQAAQVRLEGVVTAWSQCDEVSETLEGVQVAVSTSSGDSFILTTGADGTYAAWLATGDAYTITVSHPGYVPVTANGTAQTGMLPRNVSLRIDLPCVSVTPTSFDETLPKERTLTRTLTIHNVGAGDFAYDDISGSSLWLSVAPKTGVVPADSSVPVVLTFDSTGLVAGDVYSTVLEIAHTNAAVERLFVRPVRLTVLDEPAVRVDVVKTADPADFVLPGELITYTVVFTNSYDMPLDLTASDPVPANTTYVLGSVSGATVADPPGNAVTWAGSLEAGATVTFSFVVRVNDDVELGTLITNTVTVTANDLPFTAEAVVRVGRVMHTIYLPLVMRNAQ